MSKLRSYADPCGIARALDVVGERWALLVVRELVLGPKRFGELRSGLPGASPNVLAQRLRELEGCGVIRRAAATSRRAAATSRRAAAARGEPVPATAGAAYELTAWGQELHPLLRQLGAWGARAPVGAASAAGELSPDALLVALESTFQPARAAELSATIELQLGGRRFAAVLAAGALAIHRGAAAEAEAVVVTDVPTLRAVAFGDVSLEAAEESASMELRGDKRLGRRFLRCFARPARRDA